MMKKIAMLVKLSSSVALHKLSYSNYLPCAFQVLSKGSMAQNGNLSVSVMPGKGTQLI